MNTTGSTTKKTVFALTALVIILGLISFVFSHLHMNPPDLLQRSITQEGSHDRAGFGFSRNGSAMFEGASPFVLDTVSRRGNLRTLRKHSTRREFPGNRENRYRHSNSQLRAHTPIPGFSFLDRRVYPPSFRSIDEPPSA